MKVYVIMGNDYPEAVCSTEELADKYIAKKKGEEPERRRLTGILTPIYWRAYDFDLVETLP